MDSTTLTIFMSVTAFIVGTGGTILGVIIKDAITKTKLQGKDELTDQTIKAMVKEIENAKQINSLQEKSISNNRESIVSIRSEMNNFEKRVTGVETFQQQESREMRTVITKVEKSISGLDATVKGLADVMNMILREERKHAQTPPNEQFGK